MDTRLWGPHLWETMHIASFHMSEQPSLQEQKNILNLIYAIGKTLPCDNCRQHFSDLLKSFPPEQYIHSRDQFSRWLVEAHNRVNERLQKPRMDYDFVKQKYDSMRATTCSDNDSKNSNPNEKDCCIRETNSTKSSFAVSSHKQNTTTTILIVIGMIVLVSLIIILIRYNKK